MPEIPDWRAKKELLWGEKSTDEERAAAAAAFLEARRFSEALDFFSRLKDRKGVEQVLSDAVAQGDWFLFKRCTVFLGEDRKDDLRALADSAMKRGKYLFALRAFRSLGDAAGLETAMHRLRDAFPDSTLLLSQLEEESGLKSDSTGEAEAAEEAEGKPGEKPGP